MAASIRLCCALRITIGGAAPLRTIGGAVHISQLASQTSAVLQRNPAVPLFPATSWQQTRHSSFFNKLTAAELWKGVLADAGSGNKKGRGKRTKRKQKKDLNRGQVIGEGIFVLVLFVVQLKSVSRMTAKEGRKRTQSCLVAVGNGQGAAGFALGKAADRMTALRKAKNRAIHYLHYIERYNDHTVFHDIESQCKKTTLRMKKQNEGYGLHCHRVVISVCKLIGIRDMYCKVEGSVNTLNITRALFNGLASQELHQTLSDKKQLHVIEFQEHRGPLPMVVASPKDGARPDPEPEDEVHNTKLNWKDVRVAQGLKHSVWANVKRNIL
ncbi:small ribosomal subunit protein uS5m [Cottoperca gobio]|uniref:Small ribosomal subunit protein uS5m n=1 Tax=Cottoperca gobio TaxID=56716 RepID=A0A6J2R768_COTGO|nr:28S ribosomal protein S5, mitochondrial [Cottoperca gobio]